MKTSADLGGWDVHTHIIPPAVIAAGEKGLFGMRAEPKTLHICAHGVPLHPLSKIDALVERVKGDGLDGAIVSVPPPLFRPDLTANRSRQLHSPHQRQPACRHAVRISLRCAHSLISRSRTPNWPPDVASRLDNNWAGAVAGTELGLLSYASERYDALWQTLSDAKLPLFIHPGSSPDTRLDHFYLSNLLGNPVETTIAAANLIFAGVMHRFPGLEGNSCSWRRLRGRPVRALAARRRPPTDREFQSWHLQPLDAVRRFYVDSLVHSPAYLQPQ